MSLGEDGHSQLGAGFKVTAHECRPPVMIAQQPTLAGLPGRATGGQVETQVKRSFSTEHGRLAAVPSSTSESSAAAKFFHRSMLSVSGGDKGNRLHPGRTAALEQHQHDRPRTSGPLGREARPSESQGAGAMPALSHSGAIDWRSPALARTPSHAAT